LPIIIIVHHQVIFSVTLLDYTKQLTKVKKA